MRFECKGFPWPFERAICLMPFASVGCRNTKQNDKKPYPPRTYILSGHGLTCHVMLQGYVSRATRQA